MKKADFLTAALAARQQWGALVDQFPGDTPLPSGWSLKDTLYHVMWHEREMVGVLRQRALRGSRWWLLPLDERNAAILAEGRAIPWETVLAEARQVWQALWELLQQVSDEDLTEAARFADMPAEWLPWQVIASNTYEHYPQHSPDLQAALA